MAAPKKRADQPKIEAPKEQTFTVTEGAANTLLAMITKLPWENANPIIQHIQQNFKPLNTVPAEPEKEEADK